MLIIINKILWAIATSVILISSIYLTIFLAFPQIKLKNIFKNLKNKENKGISTFATFMMTLAGKIGVGSIAGVALAIYIGGPGSIFWLWIMTILSSVLCYSEVILGNIYKEKDGNYYKGGPNFYIKNGLGYKKLGGIYSIIIIISYICGFISIQTNTITRSITEVINISPYLIGIILVILCFFLIYKGVKEISIISSKLVPIMFIFYLFFCILILIKNIYLLPRILNLIIKDAFNFKPFITGFLTSLIVGIQRGIFATESGLGTSSIVSSVSDTNDSVSLANTQVFGVYLTSFIICTLTSFVILSSNYIDIDYSIVNGIEITENAFLYHIPVIGKYIIIISIFFFAISTVLTGYYYGESSYKYLDKNINKIKITILKIITLIMVFLGCVLKSDIIWTVVDSFVAILSIINIYAIIKLRKDIYEVTLAHKLKK